MISKFQVESVGKLLDAGVTNYVQIRQQVGLTSAELDDIIQNRAYYEQQFAEQERIARVQELQEAKSKKKWWQR